MLKRGALDRYASASGSGPPISKRFWTKFQREHDLKPTPARQQHVGRVENYTVEVF